MREPIVQINIDAAVATIITTARIYKTHGHRKVYVYLVKGELRFTPSWKVLFGIYSVCNYSCDWILSKNFYQSFVHIRKGLASAYVRTM